MKLLESLTPSILFTQAVAQQAEQGFLDALYQFMTSYKPFSKSLPLKAALLSEALMALEVTTPDECDAQWRIANFYVQGAFGPHRQLYENQFKAWVPFHPDYALARVQHERAGLFLHFFREQQGVVSALYRFDLQFTLVSLSHHTETFLAVGNHPHYRETFDMVRLITADCAEQARILFIEHLVSKLNTQYPGDTFERGAFNVKLERLAFFERDALRQQ